MFKVEFDATSGLVLMELNGFWEVKTVEDFAAQTILTLKKAKAETGRTLVLSDASRFPVQRLEVGQAFAKADVQMAPLRDRMAMIVASALSKLQGQRALLGTTTEFFSSREEAGAWLISD